MAHAISIIIPTLNEADSLPNLLSDLTIQSNMDFEVLVIDGRSQDNTKKNASEFSKKLKLRFIESPKAHLAFQKNFGAEKAIGDYLFFLDADSRIKKNVIENLYKHINKENGQLYLPYIEPSTTSRVNRMLFSFAINSVILLQKIGIPLSLGPLMVVQKELFNKIGKFNEIVYASEDHNLVIRAHHAGIKARFLSDVFCVFSMRRFESQGTLNVLWQYTRFILQTLVKGGVYTTSVEYKMGGQEFNKDNS